MLSRLARRPGTAHHLLLAALAYVPLLCTRPGELAADSKVFLYLDPGQFLPRALSLWDPNVGAGTVSHQHIGYLFPLGPYYWLADLLHVPDWIAQRLYLGTVLFAAGAGVLFLVRVLDPHRRYLSPAGALAAAIVFQLSPYAIPYAARHSVLLGPMAAMGWFIGLMVKSAREPSWRWPAAFALVVNLVAGINATSLLFAGLAPLLWLIHAVVVDREITVARALRTVLRIGVLTVGISVWWIVGLSVQGRYGLDVLRYTETAEAVSETATAPEIMRGLGYWYFYGRETIGPFIASADAYTEWLLPVGLGLSGLAVLAGTVVRWGQRSFAWSLVLVGLVVSVGAHPWNQPSPYGALFKAFTGTSSGLAMRSTPRAAPLVVLGLALLLGAGVSALRATRRQWAGAAAVALLAAVNLLYFFTGAYAGDNQVFPENVPDHWTDAARYLDDEPHDTRVLALPGIDFAAWRWGFTLDTIEAGLMDRPVIARELVPYGTPATVNLLQALDRRLQEGVLDPAAVAPIAALLEAGDVVLRADQQFERYRTARPRPTNALLAAADGLGQPVGFGPAGPNVPVPRAPLIDEHELAEPPDTPDPSPVMVYPVEGPRAIIRTESTDAPVVLAGDGEGLVTAAAVGLLRDAAAIHYAAWYAGDIDALVRAAGDDALLVVTDSNRRRGQRWGTVRENGGYTETAGEEPLAEDLNDNRLVVFPGSGDDSRTVALLDGAARIQATGYGNPISFTPEDRPARAFDGDVRTAWRVGAFADVRGERIEIDFDGPVTFDHIALIQPVEGPINRRITEARIRFDGTDPFDVALTDESHRAPGQTVTFPERTARSVSIEVLDTDIGVRPRYDALSGVGFAEIAVPGIRVSETLRPPTDLLDALGAGSLDHPLAILLERARVDAAEVVRSDEESALDRTIELPVARSFALTGEARLNPKATDETIDAIVGWNGPRARSSSRLAGFVAGRASSALDGDPTTAWVPSFGDTERWIEIETGDAVTFDHLDLGYLDDGEHSVPTRVRIEAGGRAVDVDVVAGEPVRFAPLAGSTIRLTVVATDQRTTIDYYGGVPVELPVAITELGLSGVEGAVPASADLDPACRDDLVELDGAPVAVRLVGASDAAADRRPIRVEGCAAVALAAGTHRLIAANGRDTAIDLDLVTLGSATGGQAADVGALWSPVRSAPPAVTTRSHDRTSFDLRVEQADEPFWLVLGEGFSEGWHASADGADLGEPVLVDGHSIGWLVSPTEGPIDIELRWTPQRQVVLGVVLSSLVFLVCIGLVVRRPRQSGPPHPTRVAGLPVGVAALSITAGVVAAATTRPWIGPVVALATYVAYRHRDDPTKSDAGGGLVFRAVGLGLVGFSFAGVVVTQALERYPSGFQWPALYERWHHPVIVGIIVLTVAAFADPPPTRSSG